MSTIRGLFLLLREFFPPNNGPKQSDCGSTFETTVYQTGSRNEVLRFLLP